MRVDQNYLKDLLNVFLNSERHFTEISEFEKAGISIDDKFLFHFQILEDQKFIDTYNDENFFGYHVALSGNFEWVGQILRLTAAGNEFAESLNKPEIFDILAKEFKNASVSTLSSVAKELMIAFAKKQAKKYFELGT